MLKCIERMFRRHLRDTEFRILNRVSSGGPDLEQRQLRLIDLLRKKYRFNFRINRSLDLHDWRTGAADREIARLNRRLKR